MKSSNIDGRDFPTANGTDFLTTYGAYFPTCFFVKKMPLSKSARFFFLKECIYSVVKSAK